MKTDWGRLNAMLEARSSGHCERCGFPILPETAERHHRRLRSQGGLDDVTNLAYLCPRCHQRVHAYPQQSYRDGWIVPSHVDWRAVPIRSASVGMVLLREDGRYDLWFPGPEATHAE